MKELHVLIFGCKFVWNKQESNIDEIIFSDLVQENRDLDEKRLELSQKIQDERTSCINLRVQIRLEQERIQRRRNNKK